jgi:uncharacterized protein
LEGFVPDESQNVALLQKAYQRWRETRGGNADEWLAICADKIQFGSLAQGQPAQASYLTTYQDRNALREYFAGLSRDWEMIDYVVEHFVAQGDRVVAICRCSWRFKRTGKVVTTPKADSWRFAGGKAVEFYEYYDTAQVQAAVV